MQRLSTLLVPTAPTCQPSKQWRTTALDQSEADTVLFSVYAVLRESGYSGPVVIDAADTDAYVAAAFISRQLPGILCIKRKQEMVLCRELVTDEMADCIVQLHCMTGCDANSGFYGKGKKSVYDRVAKSPVAQQQLSRCGDSLDLEEEEEVLEELFQFTRHVICGNKKSSTMAEALPPRKLLGISCASSLEEAPPLATWTWLGAGGWSLSPCPPHTTCSPTHLPASGPDEESDEDESEVDESEEDESEEGDEENDYVQGRREDSSESGDSESSEAECSDDSD